MPGKDGWGSKERKRTKRRGQEERSTAPCAEKKATRTVAATEETDRGSRKRQTSEEGSHGKRQSLRLKGKPQVTGTLGKI